MSLHELCELVRVSSAQPLASYSDDFYAGHPALTVNHFGRGTAYFLAARAEDAFYNDFYGLLIEQIGVEPALGSTELPDGVTASLRLAEDGTKYIIVQNFNAKTICFPLDESMTELESGASGTSVTLQPYGVMFLTK